MSHFLNGKAPQVDFQNRINYFVSQYFGEGLIWRFCLKVILSFLLLRANESFRKEK